MGVNDSNRKNAFVLIIDRDRTALDDVDILGCGAVHWASFQSDMAMLKLLDYFQCDFQAKNTRYLSCLGLAVIGGGGSFEVCEFLLKKDINPYFISLNYNSGESYDVLEIAEEGIFVVTRVCFALLH